MDSGKIDLENPIPKYHTLDWIYLMQAIFPSFKELKNLILKA